MMNLTEKIAADIMHHLARLTDGDRIFTPIGTAPDKYWALRNQIEKIIENRILESLREERYI